MLLTPVKKTATQATCNDRNGTLFSHPPMCSRGDFVLLDIFLQSQRKFLKEGKSGTHSRAQAPCYQLQAEIFPDRAGTLLSPAILACSQAAGERPCWRLRRLNLDAAALRGRLPQGTPVGDPPFRQIVGRDGDRHRVARQDADKVFPYSPCNVGD